MSNSNLVFMIMITVIAFTHHRYHCLFCVFTVGVGLQEAASDAAAAAQARLQAAEEAATAAGAASREAAEAAATRAMEEHDNLRRVLDAVNAQKADLEGKLAKAGGALNAAEELKEAKCALHLACCMVLADSVCQKSLLFVVAGRLTLCSKRCGVT